MVGHLIRLVEVPRQGSCNVLCYMEPDCVSINLGPSQRGNYICELNNASHESPGSPVLQSKQDYTHLSIEVKGIFFRRRTIIVGDNFFGLLLMLAFQSLY